MPFSETSFDAETKAVATRALEDACEELRGGVDELDPSARTMAKIKILAALVEGERDPEKLKAVAVETVK